MSLNARGNKEESVDRRLYFHAKMVILAGCSRMQTASNRRDGDIYLYIYVYNVKLHILYEKGRFVKIT